MFRSALLRKLSFALSLSVVTVAAAVVAQGFLLFPDHFRKAWAPPPTLARQFSLGCDGRVALVLLTILPQQYSAHLQTVAVVGDLSRHPPCFRLLELREPPWNVVSASASQHGFLITESGALYSLDLAALAGSFTLLGRHDSGYSHLLECTADGSLVIVASEHVTAWDRAAAKLLWQRTDIRLMSCAFVPGSRRLICGLESGELVELDATTGISLRQIAQNPAPRDSIIAVTVSPDGERVATVDGRGNCLVTHLATAHPVWSHRRQFAGGLQFSPDGQALLVPNFDEGISIALVSLPSGTVVAKLCGLEGVIQNVRVTANGTAYFWNNHGTMTAWNLATGSITSQFTPRLESPPTSGSSSRLSTADQLLGMSLPAELQTTLQY